MGCDEVAQRRNRAMMEGEMFGDPPEYTELVGGLVGMSSIAEGTVLDFDVLVRNGEDG